MRFGIIGTGAIGALFASYLCKNGETVCCYDVNESIVDTINNDGIRIERSDKDDILAHPTASTSPSELGTVDIAFIFTKTMYMDDALMDAKPMIGSDTVVVTLQNGLLNMETVGEHIPMDRVLGGYTRMGANTVRPGHIQQMMDGKTVIGGEDFDAAKRVGDSLNNAGIDVLSVADPEPYIWDKQFVNVAIKPVAALSELRNGPMIEYSETRTAMRNLIEEAMKVARAKNVEILSEDPVDKVINRKLTESEYEKKSSILEDVENERLTEIDQINGAVVTLGEELGVDTPYNEIITQLVKGKEQSYSN